MIRSVIVNAFDNVLDEGRIKIEYSTDKGWNQIIFTEQNHKWSCNCKDRELLEEVFDKFLSDIGL